MVNEVATAVYDILPDIQAKQPSSKILSQLKRGLGLLGCEKGREEESGPRSRSWI
jgi:hypothetical protein